MSNSTSTAIIGMLRQRYRPPEWVAAAEVRSATGFGARRSCDFLAMNCWPSKGLHRHGHEIKVARSDWLREIQDPSKAAEFDQRCHFFWIVAPKGVVELNELPANWGYMQAGKSLRVKKAAALTEPVPLDPEFVASFVRSVQASVENSDAVQAIQDEWYERGVHRGKQDAKLEEKSLAYELTKLRNSVKQFERVSGIDIGRYNGRQLGEAVATLLEAGSGPASPQVEAALKNLDRAKRLIEATRAACRLLETKEAN